MGDALSLDEEEDAKMEMQEEIKCEEEEETEDSDSSFSATPREKVFKQKSGNGDGDAELNELKTNCPEDAQKLFGLFQIAECYEIEELIIACWHKLRGFITIETCCIFLIYLDKYTHLEEIKKIKGCILDFIVANIKTIKLSS